MKPVLFAGPTLHGASMCSKFEFDIRPPARCGDILKAVKRDADQIGLIDGFFGDCRSVWHKEILFALSHGVQIFGAASMGALRAAECDRYGMIGIGRIYTDFRHGRRTADSDVAVLHGPQETGFVPLTLALVDAEATIHCLEKSSAITADEASAFYQAARQLGFRRRTWDALFAASGFTDTQARQIKVEFREAFVSHKTQDAMALIDFMTNSGYNNCQLSNLLTPARTVYLERLINALSD